MDQGKVLQIIYNGVTHDNFNYGSFDKRLELQKIIYLLQELGLNVGGYYFSWYKYGPYSQSLQEDAYRSSPANGELVFTDYAKPIIEKLSNLIMVKTEKYSRASFLEAIASIRYLMKHYHFDETQVLHELTKRKPYLNNIHDNEMALKTVLLLFS